MDKCKHGNIDWSDDSIWDEFWSQTEDYDGEDWLLQEIKNRVVSWSATLEKLEKIELENKVLKAKVEAMEKAAKAYDSECGLTYEAMQVVLKHGSEAEKKARE